MNSIKIKNICISVILLISTLFFSACLLAVLSGGSSSSGKKGDIPREYWGTWIKMDDGIEYYIDSATVYKINYYGGENTPIQDGISGFELDGENVLKNENYVYFRKGGHNRSFSLMTSGFADSNARAASIGKQGINGRRQNKNNEDDNEEKVSDEAGKLNFENAVAGDVQDIVISSGDTETNISLVPKFDGENVGSIPLVEDGAYGFKTSYAISCDSMGCCIGNFYKDYDLTLSIKNIGNAPCAASVYSISTLDSNLIIVEGKINGNFSTIEPDKSQEIKLKVMYGGVTRDFVDVPLNISISDRETMRTWEDSISLRFYKGYVPIHFTARNFNENNYSKLNGFVIYPDGRSDRFEIRNDENKTINLPWSESDYILAFSGATADNEMAYSFGLDGTSYIKGVWEIEDMNAYKSNTASDPYVTDPDNPVKAYLGVNDIHFFKINNSKKTTKNEPVKVYDYNWIDSGKDKDVNPGETISIDVRLRNSSKVTIKDITAKLESNSEYLQITKERVDYGDVASSCYKTCYDAQKEDKNLGYAGFSTNSPSKNSFLDATKGFYFKISENCPIGTKIKLTLKLNDKTGVSWESEIGTLEVKALKTSSKNYY